MRKYQQLALLVVSVISVSVLLMYKSENNKLKYVLQVVNFFGRSDAAMMALKENTTAANHLRNVAVQPMPVWQYIGEEFFAYSAFWHNNDLVQGGTAQAIVVGKAMSVVSFSCFLVYEKGRQMQGKFRFQHLHKDSAAAQDSNTKNAFQSYLFSCHTTKVDSGRPVRVQFRTKAAAAYNLPLFYSERPKNSIAEIASICLDLVNANSSASLSRTERSDQLKQFFLHHLILGFENFIIYDANELPKDVLDSLDRFQLKLQMLPFNFPFAQANASAALRELIKQDCLMRSAKFFQMSLLLEANEFLYTKQRLMDASVLQALNPQAGHNLRLHSYAVCRDSSKNLLVDNHFYDPDVRLPHEVKLYRPQYQLSNGLRSLAYKSEDLPISSAFLHKYGSCDRVAADGLADWRNAVREDFMTFLQDGRRELTSALRSII